MRKKYRALDRRVLEMEKVVDRCLQEHGRHLHDSTILAIRAMSVRYAEGLLCLMTAEELIADSPEPTMLRERLASEVRAHTVVSIANGLPSPSRLVN